MTRVTGCEPDKTGVGQNQPPQPGVPKAERVWYWERKYVQVPTLFEVFKYLGVQDIAWHQPKNLPYPTENPWA